MHHCFLSHKTKEGKESMINMGEISKKCKIWGVTFRLKLELKSRWKGIWNEEE